MKIERALLSVSDKSGIVDFARALHDRGVQLLSTGGTAKLLAQAGLPVQEVSDYTGFPEMMDGRVKTLHPKIHGGLLARRDAQAHLDAIAGHGIGRIDLLVVNLYPFRETVAKPDCTFADAVMIGRAAQGRPWLFREIDHYLRTGTRLPAPTQAEMRELLLQHLDDHYRFYGEYTGVRTARKHIGWYLGSLPGGPQFCAQLNLIENTRDQWQAVADWFDHPIDTPASRLAA